MACQLRTPEPYLLGRGGRQQLLKQTSIPSISRGLGMLGWSILDLSCFAVFDRQSIVCHESFQSLCLKRRRHVVATTIQALKTKNPYVFRALLRGI
jgi:hypothetical protein